MTVLPQLYVQYVHTLWPVHVVCSGDMLTSIPHTYIHMYISATCAACNTDVCTCVCVCMCVHVCYEAKCLELRAYVHTSVHTRKF